MLTKKQIKEIVDNLRCDTAAAEPQDFDFGEGYGETWETIDPDLSDWSNEKLRDYARGEGVSVENIPTPDPDDPDDDIDDELSDWRRETEEETLENMHDSDTLTPMMNYLYPIDGCNMSGPQIQAAILGTSLVAVEVNGATFLALAGGGMDFSWEICEAYALIGCCPPLHFRPEADCSDPDSDRVRLVVAAYLKSCEVMINRATWARKDIRHTVKRLREHKAERLARDAAAKKPAHVDPKPTIAPGRRVRP